MLNTALAILQGIMLLLLLAVCGNVANLMLARASARQKEMGIRLALGARPWRVASLLLTENVVLAVLGAALGAAFAVWGTQGLLVLPLTGLPIRFQTSIDGVGLAFAMVPRGRMRTARSAPRPRCSWHASIHSRRFVPASPRRAAAGCATR